jgi:hypothetical protein
MNIDHRLPFQLVACVVFLFVNCVLTHGVDNSNKKTVDAILTWSQARNWTVAVKSRVLDIEAPSAHGPTESAYESFTVRFTYKDTSDDTTPGSDSWVTLLVEVSKDKRNTKYLASYDCAHGGLPVSFRDAHGNTRVEIPRDLPLDLPRFDADAGGWEDASEELKTATELFVQTRGKDKPTHLFTQRYARWQRSPDQQVPPASARIVKVADKDMPFVLTEKTEQVWMPGICWWTAYKRYRGDSIPVLEARLVNVNGRDFSQGEKKESESADKTKAAD